MSIYNNNIVEDDQVIGMDKDPNEDIEENANIDIQIVQAEDNEKIDMQVKRKRGIHSKPRSTIWSHFSRIEDNVSGIDEKKVISNRCTCNYCGKNYKCDPNLNGTSALWKHWRVCKMKPLKADGSQTELNFAKDQGGETSLTSWKYDHNTIKREMALMCMEMELPFKFFEHPRFRNLCKLLQPRYTAISRQTCRREIVKVYEEEKVKLKKYFLSNGKGVCITTDTWTSNRGTSFLSITAHFIDEKWRLNKKIINFSQIISHKGEYSNIIAPTNGGGSSSFPQTQQELSDGERAKLKYEMLLSSLGGGANLTDMDKYLSETNERPQKDFDILKWWHLSCNRFPILSVMARDLLSIPISTVASESVFSTSGRVLSSFRSSLTPKIAETLICGADWIPKLSEILTHMNDMDEDLEELESFENEIGMYQIN